MTTSAMAQKLNTQMNREFRASHLYVSLSNWCMEANKPGIALFLRTQAQKCITRTMRIFDYLKRTGTYPVFKAVDLNPEQVNSPGDVFNCALENQMLLSHELEELMEEAKINTDNPTLNLLLNIYQDQQHTHDELIKHRVSDDQHRAHPVFS